jgi:hypothetical protein
MTMTAMFNDVDDLARFCAGLARENVSFEVRPGQAAGYYEVIISGPQS